HRQYVLMVPAVLQNDSPGQVCLQFLSVNQTIFVRVILEYGAVNTQPLLCFSVSSQISPVSSVLLAFISFSAHGNTVSLEEQRSVMIWNMESIVFGQTDKPIYKPGQSVMFCVVALDFNFRPVQEMEINHESVFFFFQDPREMNIVQIEFPLTEKPILGNYKIIIAKKSGDKTNHSFLVEEYGKCHLLFLVRVENIIRDEILSLNLFDCKHSDSVEAICKTKYISLLWACLTGLQLTATWSISITQVMSSIQFENMDRHYRRGIPYFGQVSKEIKMRYICSFFFPTPCPYQATYKTSDQCHSEGWIEPSYPDASVSIQCFYSWTNSFVRIELLWKDLSCGQKKMITVHYVWNTEEYESINIMNFYYGMAKGETVLTGENKIFGFLYLLVPFLLLTDQNGTFTIPLVVNEKMAPALWLLVYTLHPAKELVADSVRFPVKKCFKNKVQLQFSEKQIRSAFNVSLVIEAAANSFCAVRAVDQSVLLLKSETELSDETVYSLHPLQDLRGYIFNGLNLEDDPQDPCVSSDNIFHNGLYYTPVMSGLGPDVYQFLRDMGMKFFTNSRVQQPVMCASETVRPQPYFLNVGFTASTHHVKSSVCETSLFQTHSLSISISSTGKASFAYTIPDTITEWKASAFCVEDLVGFGISVPATLTAFQPFFVDLTLPYSIIQGENFLLRANVFNYLNHCMKVCTYAHIFSSCSISKEVAALNRTNHSVLRISVRKLCGTIEAIEAHPGPSRTLSTELKLLFISVALSCANLPGISHFPGDIMGTAMQDVQQLLWMPFGCGEQNMVLFAPNMYVLDYLNKTEQLSEEVKFKAIGYLVSRYQKQLSYKHPDGSYSVFGTKDKEGNIWLTVFVYKSSAQANRFIYIDANVQAQTLMWLASKQKPDGCFQSVGKLFNNALKGTVDDELSLCAYITIAMLKTYILLFSLKYPVVRNSFFCLETASEKNISDIYTQALMAYAFCLAGKMEKCESFLRELQKSAKTLGEFQPFGVFGRWGEGIDLTDAEVEITSYVLLAFLYKLNQNQEDLTKASGVVQWIIRQQNPYGGFSSTQDTIIALQALAAYGEATYNSVMQNVVKITSKKHFEKIFIVNKENRLLMQQIPLPEVPGNYYLTVNGGGCVLMQTALRYNIHLPEGAFGFSLSVQIANASCPLDRPTKFDIVLASRSSNMVIIDVKMLSGFVPVKLMTTLSLRSQILQKKRKEITFSVEQDFVGTNPKPSPVQIYDYYETGRFLIFASMKCGRGRDRNRHCKH
uniref:OVOS protein n=1 Tax=Apteryx owenii TaxID=8824 RepID=A0A8B9NRJ9_APTOW